MSPAGGHNEGNGKVNGNTEGHDEGHAAQQGAPDQKKVNNNPEEAAAGQTNPPNEGE